MQRRVVGLVLVLVFSLIAPTSVATAAIDGATDRLAEPTGLATTDGMATADRTSCTGRVTSAADGLTIVSVQGARFAGGAEKTKARIIAYGSRGQVEWIHRSGQNHSVVWSYDIDPMDNGNLFVTATQPSETLIYELNTTTGEREWVETLPITDTHDADLIAPDRVAVANMRAHNGSANNDRVFVYNLTTDEITWEWRFAPHYNRSVGGNYTEDWTHVNDVDKVGEDKFLLSPRNFDQVILVDRSTGDIELRLGAYGQHSILKKQHNPDYLESESGAPTFLVADSDNDRIVEYEHTESGWERTWEIGNASVFSWPRDADRLANGNTLIGDSRNNRVVEVTPDGKVVWEVYAPWLVYDVERIPGDGSDGPTMRDTGAPSSPTLTGVSPPNVTTMEQCDAALANMSSGFPATATSEGTRTTNGNQAQEFEATPERTATTVPLGTGGIAAATLIALLVVVWWRRVRP